MDFADLDTAVREHADTLYHELRKDGKKNRISYILHPEADPALVAHLTALPAGDGPPLAGGFEDGWHPTTHLQTHPDRTVSMLDPSGKLVTLAQGPDWKTHLTEEYRTLHVKENAALAARVRPGRLTMDTIRRRPLADVLPKPTHGPLGDAYPDLLSRLEQVDRKGYDHYDFSGGQRGRSPLPDNGTLVLSANFHPDHYKPALQKLTERFPHDWVNVEPIRGQLSGGVFFRGVTADQVADIVSELPVPLRDKVPDFVPYTPPIAPPPPRASQPAGTVTHTETSADPHVNGKAPALVGAGVPVNGKAQAPQAHPASGYFAELEAGVLAHADTPFDALPHDLQNARLSYIDHVDADPKHIHRLTNPAIAPKPETKHIEYEWGHYDPRPSLGKSRGLTHFPDGTVMMVTRKGDVVTLARGPEHEAHVSNGIQAERDFSTELHERVTRPSVANKHFLDLRSQEQIDRILYLQDPKADLAVIEQLTAHAPRPGHGPTGAIFAWDLKPPVNKTGFPIRMHDDGSMLVTHENGVAALAKGKDADMYLKAARAAHADKLAPYRKIVQAAAAVHTNGRTGAAAQNTAHATTHQPDVTVRETVTAAPAGDASHAGHVEPPAVRAEPVAKGSVPLKQTSFEMPRSERHGARLVQETDAAPLRTAHAGSDSVAPHGDAGAATETHAVPPAGSTSRPASKTPEPAFAVSEVSLGGRGNGAAIEVHPDHKQDVRQFLHSRCIDPTRIHDYSHKHLFVEGANSAEIAATGLHEWHLPPALKPVLTAHGTVLSRPSVDSEAHLPLVEDVIDPIEPPPPPGARTAHGAVKPSSGRPKSIHEHYADYNIYEDIEPHVTATGGPTKDAVFHLNRIADEHHDNIRGRLENEGFTVTQDPNLTHPHIIVEGATREQVENAVRKLRVHAHDPDFLPSERGLHATQTTHASGTAAGAHKPPPLPRTMAQHYPDLANSLHPHTYRDAAGALQDGTTFHLGQISSEHDARITERLRERGIKFESVNAPCKDYAERLVISHPAAGVQAALGDLHLLDPVDDRYKTAKAVPPHSGPVLPIDPHREATAQLKALVPDIEQRLSGTKGNFNVKIGDLPVEGRDAVRNFFVAHGASVSFKGGRFTSEKLVATGLNASFDAKDMMTYIASRPAAAELKRVIPVVKPGFFKQLRSALSSGHDAYVDDPHDLAAAPLKPAAKAETVVAEAIAKTEAVAAKSHTSLGTGLALAGTAGVGLLGLAAMLRGEKAPARAIDAADNERPLSFANSTSGIGGIALPIPGQKLENWAASVQTEPGPAILGRN